MKRLLKCLQLTAISAMLSTYFPARAEHPDADILGRWRIVRDVSPDGAISSMTQRDVDRLIGKQLFVASDLFEFNAHKCVHPEYKRSVDDAADYFYREWRVNSSEMPIGPHLTIVENRCMDHVLYPTGKDRMVVEADGLFFEAVRVRGHPDATSNSVGNKVTRSSANADIFGTWTIDGADWKGSGYDSEATKKKKAGIFMGMPVYIGADRFFYNDNTCHNPTYKRSRQDKTAYFHADWRAAKGRLPFLPQTLTVIETECGTIYPISKKEIVIEDKHGMFFSAVSQ